MSEEVSQKMSKKEFLKKILDARDEKALEAALNRAYGELGITGEKIKQRLPEILEAFAGIDMSDPKAKENPKAKPTPPVCNEFLRWGGVYLFLSEEKDISTKEIECVKGIISALITAKRAREEGPRISKPEVTPTIWDVTACINPGYGNPRLKMKGKGPFSRSRVTPG